ncbi:hemin uptake protein HemP [Loktanella sp. Alg231-35]|uniref:hemin uptake protein HemP n=1 Tax=Loktanella sp. Alg231-35 TaxID=1922220 RepID=UPI000D56133D|nr:hemin uptake protein HemP [Loktanella sp. Alg231-35]
MGLQRAITTDGQSLRELPCHDARDLVKNGVQAQIILDDQIYVLRITRAGKLILTK